MSFPTGWTRKVASTIPAAQIGSGGVTAFTFLFTDQNTDFPAEMFTLAKSDGSDIRVSTGSDGSGLLTLDVIRWDPTNSKCIFRVGTTDGSAVVDNVLYWWYGYSSATAQTGSGAYNADWAAYWPLDGDANDRTGTGANLSLVNSPSYSTGKIGQALNLSAASSQYAKTSVSIVDPSLYNCTFLGWANLSSLVNAQYILQQQDGGGTGRTWIGVNTSAIPYSYLGGANTSGSTTLSTNTWYQVGVVAPISGTLQVLLNGTVDGSASRTAEACSGGFFAGVDKPLVNYMNGLLCDLQLHKAQRSSAWITTEYNQANDPASFASFGTPQDVGISGAISLNSVFSVGASPTENAQSNLALALTSAISAQANADMQAAAALALTAALQEAGSTGAAYQMQLVTFDGTSNYLTRDADLTADADGQKGILSFWLKTSQTSTSYLISNGAQHFYIYSNLLRVAVIGFDASATLVLKLFTANPYNDGALHHVCASWDLSAGAGTGAIVVDRVDDTDHTSGNYQAVAGRTLVYTDTDWGIGGTPAGGSLFAGELADIYLNLGTYLDLSLAANLDKFVDASINPVDLGADGSMPTGTAPILFLHGALSTWQANDGTGGGFTLHGTLGDGGLFPSGATHSAALAVAATLGIAPGASSMPGGDLSLSATLGLSESAAAAFEASVALNFSSAVSQETAANRVAALALAATASLANQASIFGLHDGALALAHSVALTHACAAVMAPGIAFSAQASLSGGAQWNGGGSVALSAAQNISATGGLDLAAAIALALNAAAATDSIITIEGTVGLSVTASLADAASALFAGELSLGVVSSLIEEASADLTAAIQAGAQLGAAVSAGRTTNAGTSVGVTLSLTSAGITGVIHTQTPDGRVLSVRAAGRTLTIESGSRIFRPGPRGNTLN